MQSGKQFERLQKEAIVKLRSRFHAQTLSNEFAREVEKASLRRPEIFKLSRQLMNLREEHRKDPNTSEHCRRAASRILDTFPSYSVDEDPQFVCSLRLLRTAAYFRGSLLQQPPRSVQLALQHHVSHTFLWDAPAAVGFLTVLPSLANTFGTNHRYDAELDESFGQNAIGKSGLVPDLHRTMKVVTPRVYQLASQFTPSEALAVVAAYGTVDPELAVSEQSSATLFGGVNPSLQAGLALEEFSPAVGLIDFEAPLLGYSEDASGLSTSGSLDPIMPPMPQAGAASSQHATHKKSIIHALSTVSLMCEDHKDVSEMCRFVYYSSALSLPVGTAHLLCLQPKLMTMAHALSVDDIVALCRCISRTRKASRRLLMAVGRRALLLLGDMSASAIGEVLYAFQMANQRHQPLIKRCATRQLMLLEAQTPQSAAATLSCMAHFGIADELTFNALGRRVHKMEMDGTVVASLLHSCAKAGVVVPTLFADPFMWFVDARRMAEEELTSNIAIVLWASTRLAEVALGAKGGAEGVTDQALLRLVSELLKRFKANPAMAQAKGASEVRIHRQTMAMEGCMCALRVAEAAISTKGSPFITNPATARLLQSSTKELIAILAQ